jgi:hypothetical protein
MENGQSVVIPSRGLRCFGCVTPRGDEAHRVRWGVVIPSRGLRCFGSTTECRVLNGHSLVGRNPLAGIEVLWIEGKHLATRRVFVVIPSRGLRCFGFFSSEEQVSADNPWGTS